MKHYKLSYFMLTSTKGKVNYYSKKYRFALFARLHARYVCKTFSGVFGVRITQE